MVLKIYCPYVLSSFFFCAARLNLILAIGCVEQLKNKLLDMPDSNYHGTWYRKHNVKFRGHRTTFRYGESQF